MRLSAPILAFALLTGCWPAVPDDLEPSEGEVIVRSRAVEGDTFVKLKGGLARDFYRALRAEGEERCVEPRPDEADDGHCRRRARHLICSTENLRDPYVCELHLVDGGWVAPRDDWELYHSLEANRRYGVATFDGAAVTMDGDAAEALAEALSADGPVSLVVDPVTGQVTGP